MIECTEGCFSLVVMSASGYGMMTMMVVVDGSWPVEMAADDHGLKGNDEVQCRSRKGGRGGRD